VQSPLVGADLSGSQATQLVIVETDARELDLSGGRFERFAMTGCDLNASRMIETKFRSAFLDAPPFPTITLDRTDFANTFIPGADMREKDLKGCRFFQCILNESNLAGADLTGVELTQTQFMKADLTGTRFGNARATYTQFGGATLKGTDFGSADIRWSNFDGSEIEMVSLKGAKANQSMLRAVRANGLDLTDTNLRESDLSESVFTDAQVIDADLRGSNLHSTETTRTDLTQAKLTGSRGTDKDLREAQRFRPPAYPMEYVRRNRHDTTDDG
jgi:uncharacterized protein YjbI with pentapeptide repeats